MENDAKTTITLPKGTKIFEQGGPFELGGNIARLAEDARIEFDRNLTNDEVAGVFAAANRPDMLSALAHKADGQNITYGQLGERIATGGSAKAQEKTIDRFEADRLEREKGEVESQANLARQRDVDNRFRAAQNAEAAVARSVEVAKEQTGLAENLVAKNDADIRAKAAAADYETKKDDLLRAEIRATHPTANQEPTPAFETTYEVDAQRKISPDHDELMREFRAVDKIGMDNAAVAKADKDGQIQNEVNFKDGTRQGVFAKDDPDLKETVKAVSDAANQTDKEKAAGAKETSKARGDIKGAKAELEEEVKAVEDARHAKAVPAKVAPIKEPVLPKTAAVAAVKSAKQLADDKAEAMKTAEDNAKQIAKAVDAKIKGKTAEEADAALKGIDTKKETK